jgi:serine/threonine protein kinase
VGLIFDQGNILVTQDRRALLCDFGLAKAISEGGVPSGMTTTKTIRGSLRYISPELLSDDEFNEVFAFKTDIWAWACVVLEVSHEPRAC